MLMDKEKEIKKLEAERNKIMSTTGTHAYWIKQMERLAKISAQLLMLKNNQL